MDSSDQELLRLYRELTKEKKAREEADGKAAFYFSLLSESSKKLPDSPDSVLAELALAEKRAEKAESEVVRLLKITEALPKGGPISLGSSSELNKLKIEVDNLKDVLEEEKVKNRRTEDNLKTEFQRDLKEAREEKERLVQELGLEREQRVRKDTELRQERERIEREKRASDQRERQLQENAEREKLRKQREFEQQQKEQERERQQRQRREREQQTFKEREAEKERRERSREISDTVEEVEQLSEFEKRLLQQRDREASSRAGSSRKKRRSLLPTPSSHSPSKPLSSDRVTEVPPRSAPKSSPVPKSSSPQPATPSSSSSGKITGSNLLDMMANTPPKPTASSRKPSSESKEGPSSSYLSSGDLQWKSESPVKFPRKATGTFRVKDLVQVEPLEEQTATVIVCHDQGEDPAFWKSRFASAQRALPWVRFLFPKAPSAARNWFDCDEEGNIPEPRNYRDVDNACLQVILLMNEDAGVNNIEPERVVIVGIGQGGYVAFRTGFILLNPRVAGVATLSNKLIPSTLLFDSLPEKAIGEDKEIVPLFSLCSEDDDQASLQSSVELLKKVAPKVQSTFRVYPNILPHAFADLIEWLEELLPCEFELRESDIKWL